MHRFIPDPAAASPAPDPTHTEAIKRWTREFLHLDEEVTIIVNETACVDPGCPLWETQIMVVPAQGTPRTWRFTRPKVAVTKVMIQQTLRSAPAV